MRYTYIFESKLKNKLYNMYVECMYSALIYLVVILYNARGQDVFSLSEHYLH